MRAMLDPASYFYGIYAGQGHTALSEDLQASDPFGLAPASIVQRVLYAGHTADTERPQRAWFRSFGIVSIVDQDGQRFVVSIDTEGQRISVQEVRSERCRASAGLDLRREKGG